MSGRTLRILIVVGALVIGGSVTWWQPLQFRDLSGPEVASRISVLLFFSLIIERTIEILMSIWRSEEAVNREADVQRLLSENTPATDPQLIAAQKALIRFKAETLQWSMPLGFALGLLVAGLGIRVLSQLVIFPPALDDRQKWWFNFGDVVFSGALLAGGADPIHKILDLYRKFVEASAAKAAGTRQ